MFFKMLVSDTILHIEHFYLCKQILLWLSKEEVACAVSVKVIKLSLFSGLSSSCECLHLWIVFVFWGFFISSVQVQVMPRHTGITCRTENLRYLTSRHIANLHVV